MILGMSFDVINNTMTNCHGRVWEIKYIDSILHYYDKDVKEWKKVHTCYAEPWRREVEDHAVNNILLSDEGDK